MDLQEMWEKALEQTKIIKHSAVRLSTIRATRLPYTYLAESLVNIGDTVVRKGKVVVHKPSIILPANFPQFEGFDFRDEHHVDEEAIRTFLMVRGVSFPSFKYDNQVASLNVFEGSLQTTIDHYSNKLAWKEDIDTALIIGPDDCWQFSVLIFAASMVSKSAPDDIERFFDELRKKGKGLDLGDFSF